MGEEKKLKVEVVGLTEGARRATGGSPTTGAPIGPLGPNQRWSASRKRDVVLRLLRGESLASLSREVGVEVYRLEKWRVKALKGIDNGLREREGDPLKADLDAAMKRIGELTMENELLRERIGRPDPLGRKRSRK